MPRCEALALCLALAACGVPAVTEAERAASLELLPGPARAELIAHVASRTFLIIGTHDVDGEQVLRRGAVAAVATDGYLLTCGHALGPPFQVYLQWAVDDPLAEQSMLVAPYPARVVWRDVAADLALLRVDAPLPWAFELSPDDDLAAGNVVLSAGFGHGADAERHAADMALRFVAGRVLEVERRDGRRWLRHDGPAAAGDSGGPVVTLDGRLWGTSIAVETILGPGPDRQTIAARCDPAALAARIAADRARRP